MKKFKLNVRYTFSGVFEISSDSFDEAQTYFHQHCGCTLGGGIESSLNDEEVDWEFGVHPIEERIESIEYLDPKRVILDILRENDFELPLSYEDFISILVEFLECKDVAEIIGEVYLKSCYESDQDCQTTDIDVLAEYLESLCLQLTEDLADYRF